MTCRYTNTHWRDALYNSVRAADGGVVAAAKFLTERRDTSIHYESVRRKLQGKDSINVEMALLLAEFVSKDIDAHERANDWLLALCAQEGLHVDDVPPAPSGGWGDEAKALNDKFLAITAKVGKMAAVTAQTTEDGKIDQGEADELVPLIRAARVILHRMERNVLRAVSKERPE